MTPTPVILRKPGHLACRDLMHRSDDLQLPGVDERLDDRTALGQARCRQASFASATF